MYDRFRWTSVSARRNGVTTEYEPVQPYLLLSLAEIAGCGVFLDVGANIGAYSLFATLVPGIQRIVAFEANPKTARELNRNIVLNGLENRIELIEKAVSSSAGRVRFGLVSTYSGANSVIGTTIHDRSKFHEEFTVETVALDDLFPQPISTSICIKIDVEGHESEVIDGSRTLLRSNRGVVQIEAHKHAESSSGDKLRELGYVRLTRIGPDHYYSNIDEFKDRAKVLRGYEQAIDQMIANNHRNKTVVLRRGGIGLELSGKTAMVARSLAKHLIGRRL
jgi:FkbM family methyltransferase